MLTILGVQILVSETRIMTIIFLAFLPIVVIAEF
jgi:hypothetical protein